MASYEDTHSLLGGTSIQEDTDQLNRRLHSKSSRNVDDDFIALQNLQCQKRPNQIDQDGDPSASRNTFDSPWLNTTSIRKSCSSKSPPGDPKWRPFWLRKRILGLFFCFFICGTVALLVLLPVSHQSQIGLGPAQKQHAMAWRFVPVATLTVVAIFWSRVETQAMRYIPWAAIRDGQISMLHLDYTCMLTPVVIMQSVHNKHFFIFLVSSVSIILRVLIVLSSSLFIIDGIQISSSVPIRILDSFDSNMETVSLLTIPELQPYFRAQSIHYFNASYPFGVAKQAAYQRFELDTDTGGFPTTAIVDGLFVDMDYRVLLSPESSKIVDYGPSQIDFVLKTDASNNQRSTWPFTIDMQFEDCDVVSSNESAFWDNAIDSVGVGIWLVSRLPDRPCRSFHQQHLQYLYFAGYCSPSRQDPSKLVMEKHAAIIFSPKAWISSVQVTINELGQNVTVLPDQQPQYIKANMWELIQNSIPHIYLKTGAVSGPVSEESELRGSLLDKNGTDKALYESDLLRDSLINLTSSLGPMIAHSLLRKADDSRTMGSTLVKKDILRVSRNIGIAMAILFAVCSLVASWAMLMSPKTFGTWPRDPSTILGSMALFHGFFTLGTLDSTANKTKWNWTNNRSPQIPLMASSRGAFVLYSLVLLLSLSTMLRISQTSSGLLTLPNGNFSIWWTLMPALLMSLIALYASSSDSAIRNLGTLLALSDKDRSAAEVDRAFLDMLGLKALYFSIKQKILPITLSQVITASCAFLPALSSLLFNIESIPERRPIQLEQRSWFGLPAPDNSSAYSSKINRNLMRTMIHTEHSNFSYPRHTYSDLLFPTIGFEDLNGAELGTAFELMTPAAKLTPVCRGMDKEDFNTSIQFTKTASGQFATIRLSETFDCPNGTQEVYDHFAYIYGNHSRLFAKPISSPSDPDVLSRKCQNQTNTDYNQRFWDVRTFLWGELSVSSLEFSHLSIWRCNYSWAEYPTNLRMISTEKGVQIDPTTKPTTANDFQSRPWDPPFIIPGMQTIFMDERIYPALSAQNIHEELYSLLAPKGPLNITDFGNPDKEGFILEKLHHNRALIAAQLANIENRLNIDEASTSVPTHHPKLAMINATMINEKRIRLVENQNIAIAMIVILAVAFSVNFWALISSGLRRFLGYKHSLLLNMDLSDLAPDGFNSIALARSLLDGSNYRNVVPKNSYCMSPDDLYRHLSGSRFRLGWFMRKGAAQRELTVGALNDEDFPFLGDSKL